ncbi:DUF4328 domain-containing protein [Streptomyces sp. NPDC060027]|uniref:DUF4328 domain-containing protein n=1 Tax=Streptomyces sp. NPDC060027 TaxID=3347040 RepID=UPI0036C5FDEC
MTVPPPQGPVPPHPVPQGPVPPHPVPQGPVAPHPGAPLPPLVSPHGAAWLRSPVALGKATAALLGLVIAADVFALWADNTMFAVSGALADGEFGDAVQRRADHADSLYAVAGNAQMVTLVAAVVVYLIWFLRVRVNAEVFNPFGHTKSRAWAGWGWFVPVVNLWFPRRIMLDIWDASGPAGARNGRGLVQTWWTFWIIGLLANRASFTAYRKAETAQEIQDAVGKVIFADLLDIVTAGLAILVVLRLTRMQDRKAHEGPGAHGV